MPDAAEFVDALAEPDARVRFDAYQALVAQGTAALPAIREGLKSSNAQVRQWSAMCLDQVADAETLEALVPLLRDPSAKVRLWAVHSLACEHCKEEIECPVDVVPLLIERVETDESVRVRRMAVIMLSSDFADPRAVPVLQRILNDETDEKLRRHAEAGLERLKTRC